LFVFPDPGGGGGTHLYWSFPVEKRIQLGQKYFVNGFINSNYVGSDEPLYPQQWKVWFPMSHAPQSGNYHPSLTNNWNDAGGGIFPGSLICQNYNDDYKANGGQQLIFANNEVPAVNTWWQYEVMGKVNSAPGVANGVFQGWYNGKTYGMESDWTNVALAVEEGYVYGNTAIGLYVDRIPLGQGPFYMKFDDIYIDNSWARVGIGNAATRATCTKMEYQVPVTWNANGQENTVTVNTGNIPVGTQGWIYVYNELGNVNSAGLPVLISSVVTEREVAAKLDLTCEPQSYLSTDASTENMFFLPYFNFSGSMNQWNHFQIYLKQGNSSFVGLSGAAEIYINSRKEGTFAINTFDMTDIKFWKSLMFSAYMQPDGEGTCPPSEYPFTAYFDEVLIGNSPRRVEIGDAAVYEDCTVRNVQYVTSWTDGTIQGTWNNANMPAGKLYLFVINSSGKPSAGYPLQE